MYGEKFYFFFYTFLTYRIALDGNTVPCLLYKMNRNAHNIAINANIMHPMMTRGALARARNFNGNKDISLLRTPMIFLGILHSPYGYVFSVITSVELLLISTIMSNFKKNSNERKTFHTYFLLTCVSYFNQIIHNTIF